MGGASDSAAPTGASSSRFRRIAVSFLFVVTNILAWHLSNRGQGGFPAIAVDLESFQSLLADSTVKSGVGLVTTDGMWGTTLDEKYKDEDIKILGFTDRNYVAIAKKWYIRLTLLVSVIPFHRPCNVVLRADGCVLSLLFRGIKNIILSLMTSKFRMLSASSTVISAVDTL